MQRKAEQIASRAIRTLELVIKPTYRCPLRCAHCYSYADSTKRGNLERDCVLAAIAEAARIPGMRWIGFSGGGDPCLHMDLLADWITYATELKLRTHVVTSGFWASTPDKARKSLQPLAAAGLRRLTVSHDDAHARFVSENHVRNAFAEARALGIEAIVAVTTEPGARITQVSVEELLGLPPGGEDDAWVYETKINSTGRAGDAEPLVRLGRKQQKDVYRGPCRSIFRQPSIHPDREIMPCCGTLLPREGLTIGRLGERPLDDILLDAYRDPLLRWIAFEGPAAVLQQITKDDDVPITGDEFDGVCHACDRLFSTPELLDRARRALPLKLEALHLQEAIYRACGLYEPPVPPSWTTEDIG